ncbi:DUF4382 domain-containing protein [Roseateles sp. BYS87W]|uniref:DUF4382 domain-containing protein n=1 Tax=Pelomonas baiyunensis TaxID=3299026 RepID=A0ABW7H2V2_9BURK
MSKRTSLLRIALAGSVAAAVLAACGGGGSGATASGPSVTPMSYSLQTYITDNLATEYSKVWVTLKKITAVDGSGSEVTLLDATASPVTVNLSSLADVGQFMSTVTLPAGLYAQVKVTLGNSVQLVSLNGATTVNAKFNSTGADLVWTIRDLDVNPANSGQLVLDFNLAKFTYDATTGIVTPVIERRDAGEAFGKFIRQHAEVHGTVSAVNVSAGTFTVTGTRLGGSVIVKLATDATLINEQTQAKLTLADLAVGATVEVKGTVTPGATTADPATVTTAVVHVLPAGSSSTGTDAVPRLRGAGTITAVNSSKITVSLTDANFLPSSNSVVVDTASARFSHGQSSDLAVGVAVHFTGTASSSASTAITAKVVDVDGASSTPRSGDKFTSGVQGKVSAVASSTAFTLVVSNSNSSVPAGTYSVDATNARYESGTATCLVVNAQVKVRGALSGSTLTATEIEIPGCAGQGRSSPGHH